MFEQAKTMSTRRRFSVSLANPAIHLVTLCNRGQSDNAHRPAQFGGNPVVGVAAGAAPERGDLCAAAGVAGMADRCLMSGPDQTASPGFPDRGSRSIAHNGGADPAWMTPTTLNP